MSIDLGKTSKKALYYSKVIECRVVNRETATAVAKRFNLTEATVSRWVAEYKRKNGEPVKSRKSPLRDKYLKKVIHLYADRGKSVSEISVKTGISQSTVSTWIANFTRENKSKSTEMEQNKEVEAGAEENSSQESDVQVKRDGSISDEAFFKDIFSALDGLSSREPKNKDTYKTLVDKVKWLHLQKRAYELLVESLERGEDSKKAGAK